MPIDLRGLSRTRPSLVSLIWKPSLRASFLLCGLGTSMLLTHLSYACTSSPAHDSLAKASEHQHAPDLSVLHLRPFEHSCLTCQGMHTGTCIQACIQAPASRHAYRHMHQGMHTCTCVKACIQANFSTRMILLSKHQIKQTRHSFARKLQQFSNRMCDHLNRWNRESNRFYPGIHRRKMKVWMRAGF